jgi:hypothetical protein
MNSKLIKLITVVLNIPKVIAELIVFARAIFLAMSTNSRYMASMAMLSELNTDIGLLEAAQTGFKTKPPTISVEDRNNAVEKVKADLRALRSDVQKLADNDPAHAESITSGANMSWKSQTGHGGQQNAAYDGVQSGSVILTAEGGGHHRWRWSTDGTVWTELRPTKRANKTVPGLTPGVIYHFQNCKILDEDIDDEWSQIVSIRVR